MCIRDSGAATNYTYNSLNQLMSEKGTGTNLTYRYDENGNQTGITGTSGGSNVNKTFTYTPEDMLETYTEGSASQINLYNGEGQRVQKKEGNDVTNYYYQFGNVLYTTDVNGSLKSFNLLNRIDTFGTSRKSETVEDYYLYTDDLRGSTVNVLDSSADKVASYNIEYIGFDDIFYVSRKEPCEASPLAGDICAKESSIPSCALFLLV